MDFIKKIFSKNQLVKIVFTLIVTGFIFAFIFRNTPFAETLQILKSANMNLILLSNIPFIVSIIVTVLRWHVIMNFHDKVSLKDSIIAVFASFPLNSVLPSKLGDSFKAIYFKKYGIAYVLGSVVVERIIDLFVLVIILFISSILINNTIFLLMAIGLICAFIVAFILAFMNIKIKIEKLKLINKVTKSFRKVVKNPKLSFKLFLFTIISWIMSLIQIHLLFKALGVEIDLIYFSAGIIISIFVGMLPISIAGMGTRDSAIIYLFGQYAAESSLLAGGILLSAFRFWAIAILGLPFLIYALSKKKNLRE